MENKIPDISDLAKKLSITSLLPTSTFNSKITEIENKITSVDNKIPSITTLATKTELTTLFFYKHNNYKHIEAEISENLSIL